MAMPRMVLMLTDQEGETASVDVSDKTWRTAHREFEISFLRHLLGKHNGSRRRTAQESGLNYMWLTQKMRALGLRKEFPGNKSWHKATLDLSGVSPAEFFDFNGALRDLEDLYIVQTYFGYAEDAGKTADRLGVPTLEVHRQLKRIRAGKDLNSILGIVRVNPITFEGTLDGLRKLYVTQVLIKTRGNKTATLQILKIRHDYFDELLRRYKISKNISSHRTRPSFPEPHR